MDSRRDFLKKAALLAAGGGVMGAYPASIQKAFAIDPAPGSTFLDAEHIVILMQENRSFDHCYGTLRGVRGFNDPRALSRPNGNPVWLQTNRAGETYAPFRLNIKDTKATWMNSLPHTWIDQTDARNAGWHDQWLDVKRSGAKDYAHLPLTLGFYNREDIPFYYALADAFTVCDQNFCSSLTGTTPNRLYLWTGSVRGEPSARVPANVRNEDADYEIAVNWKTFPERLEDHGISWKIYQNETSLPTGLSTEAEAWLGNYGDNPIEYFAQFHARFLPSFREHLLDRAEKLAALLAELEADTAADEPRKKKIASTRKELNQIGRDFRQFTKANFVKLSAREKSIHRKALTTNEADPYYRELTTIRYVQGRTERTMQVPKGDLFHQFRADVRSGQLPTVSWLVAPENFSDHPSAPWYGAWYLSEALDILTQNPAVWRKTIFILCYDENDGYFDHVPPFVAPHPERPETGKVSRGIDTALEYVHLEQEKERQRKHPRSAIREGPIGLGYRVPLVLASPWSRGGYVCSQLFDHTSILQLLEKILSHKTKRKIRETNISDWRRTVCGDLTSAFRPYHDEAIALPAPVARDPFVASIHQAQFKQIPNGFKKWTEEAITQAREAPLSSPGLPRQEPGVRPSCALPYELTVDGGLSVDRRSFAIRLAAGKKLFGERAAGAAFQVYAFGQGFDVKKHLPRSYAVSAGKRLSDAWSLADLTAGKYHFHVYGPNGFFREFRGSIADPLLEIEFESVRAAGAEALFRFRSERNKSRLTLIIDDLAYGAAPQQVVLGSAGPNRSGEWKVPLSRSFGWYDWRVRLQEAPHFEQRFAGRIETGQESFSDPLMGRVI